ncbi:holo-ACP synthase [Campylobacter sp. MG1]|uniref:holo-ACP synthase n=1 Tax=Campylobacter sp. MG1 TaxID=2976332 RepID=UPI00226CD7C8|nr:holo-ACP synthase [Campylobacter sp. MG1]
MIGCDIVNIKRIENIFKKNKIKFLNRIFSKEELDCLNQNINSIAGYYAAKEAASKALGCGICELCNFYDIKICKDERNKPFIVFSEKIIKEFNISRANLSISHDAGIAMAVVMLEKNNA